MTATTMGSIALEEYELMKDAKYRVYVSAVDKALKNFEYTSEWADLISALGKLNKVLLNYMKFPVIPRRIKISKRLAQCMHPALPSGVHLKALETYDIIFKCMGTNRLSHELFIYSAGLFPLLGNAAMNVRPTLLTIYETHFVPLCERLRPGLSGFLSGVFPGLEEGSDHFDRTNILLEKVCQSVGVEHFYTCLWDCLAANSSIRLPAILFVLSHFNKKLSMMEQPHVMGTNINIMISAMIAGIQDVSVLVQRSILDFLLIGFPLHSCSNKNINNEDEDEDDESDNANKLFLNHSDVVSLLTAALTTLLRRDMSLNRRLFSWLLGTEVKNSGSNEGKSAASDTTVSVIKIGENKTTSSVIDQSTYFDTYSKDLLIEALRSIMKSVCNDSEEETPTVKSSLDVKPYKILVSLLDKPEIGPLILDDILYDVFRTFYNSIMIKRIMVDSKRLTKSCHHQEVIKSANLLFSSQLEPAYVWRYCGQLIEKVCMINENEYQHKLNKLNKLNNQEINLDNKVQPIGSGAPSLLELCILIEFLLENVDTTFFGDVPSDHLPDLFHKIINQLLERLYIFKPIEITKSLVLCSKILSKIQPMTIAGGEEKKTGVITITQQDKYKADSNSENKIFNSSVSTNDSLSDCIIPNTSLEKSSSDSKLNQPIESSNIDDHLLPSKRTRAGSGGLLKKSDKKIVKKKSSKSTSKLNVSFKNEARNDSKDNEDKCSLKFQSIDDSSVNYSKINDDLVNSFEPVFDDSSIESKKSSSLSSSSSSIKRESLQSHNYCCSSVLSKCLNKYKLFYVKLISDKILLSQLKSQKTIFNIFKTLVKTLSKKNERSLESILSYHLSQDNYLDKLYSIGSSNKSSDQKPETMTSYLNFLKKFNEVTVSTTIVDMKWKQVLQVSSKLLVELSTFSICFKDSDSNSNEDDTDGNNYDYDDDSNNYSVKLKDTEARTAGNSIVLPDWLQVLVICCCWLSKEPSLQLTSITTLIDLLALSYNNNFSSWNQINKSNSNMTNASSSTSTTTITKVIIVPLLKKWHINYLVQNTNVFQIIAYSLWQHLDKLAPYKYHAQCVELLYELHYLLYQYQSCDIVEDVIGLTLAATNSDDCEDDSNDKQERQVEIFNRFATLWHLGRDIRINNSTIMKIGLNKSSVQLPLLSFNKSLLKMLDNLQLPDNSPLKLHAQSWLHHSLIRGDIARIVDPVLLMLLDASTCRMSVLYVNIQHSNTILSITKSNNDKNIKENKTRSTLLSTKTFNKIEDDNEDDDYNESDENITADAAKIYAISSVDGNVIYHVSNSISNDEGNNKNKPKRKKSLQFYHRQPQSKQLITNPVNVKRIFAVTTLVTTNSSSSGQRKQQQYVTEKNQFIKELKVPPSISNNHNISVFVNPMTNIKNSSIKKAISDDNVEENHEDYEEEDDEDEDEDDEDSKIVINNKNNKTTVKIRKSSLKRTVCYKTDDDNDTSIGGNSFDERILTVVNSDNSQEESRLVRCSSLDSLEKNSLTGTSTMLNKELKKGLNSYIIPITNNNLSRQVVAGDTLLKGKYISNNEFSSGYPGSISSSQSTDIPGWAVNNNEDDKSSEVNVCLTAEEYFDKSNSNGVVEQVLNELIDNVLEICNDNRIEDNNDYKEGFKLKAMKLKSNKFDKKKPTTAAAATAAAVAAMKRSNSKNKNKNNSGVHNLHSHMLLYCGVYDSMQTLYALKTLKAQLTTNTRMFLFAAATTGISNSSNLLTLLARHRKSVLGTSFYGDITCTKFIATYRSSMYLEVLITVCLYFMRSYYPNLGQMRLTAEEIAGNRQVQLTSAELLTLILSELVTIVRDSGRSFSCFIIDLMAKCKLQKIILFCLVSSVLNMKYVAATQKKREEENLTFTEEIVLFNDPPPQQQQSSQQQNYYFQQFEKVSNKCKFRTSNHTEAYQIQLLKLILATIMLEHQCNCTSGSYNSNNSNPAPQQKNTDDDLSTSTLVSSTAMNFSTASFLSTTSSDNLEYISGTPIPQQPIFQKSIISVLKLTHMRHLHQHWTTLVTSSLPYMGYSGFLTQLITSVINQLCCNIEDLASYYSDVTESQKMIDNYDSNGSNKLECCLPVDYTITQLEALTFLLHYCLLDNSAATQQQINFNQPFGGYGISGNFGSIYGNNNLLNLNNSNQIFTNLINVFSPSSFSSEFAEVSANLSPSSSPTATTPTPVTAASSGKEKLLNSNNNSSSSNLANNINGSNNGNSNNLVMNSNEQNIVKKAVLSHLPRIIASLSTLWQAVLVATTKTSANSIGSLSSLKNNANDSSNNNKQCSNLFGDKHTSIIIGNPRVVVYQLLELISPIAFNHGVNFLAAVAVAWHERRSNSNDNTDDKIIDNYSSGLLGIKKILPEACINQQIIVDLVGAIRVMPIDTLIKTVNQVIKNPPIINGVKKNFSLQVSVLELLYVYIKQTNITAQSLVECWSALLGLLRDSLSTVTLTTTSTSSSNLTQLPAPAQFLLLAILNEYIQRCSISSTTPCIMQEKKDIRDLQDITTKLVESCSTIAGACLEQTTWLRRNLAVREDALMTPVPVSVSSLSSTPPPPPPPPIPPPLPTVVTNPPNSAYSVQAQIVLAEILAPLLDIVYGAVDNKERVITLLTNLMYNITPYLRNHTIKNIPSFIACSQLTSSLSGYQYTRKAWRKDVLDLLLDSSFFQMPVECLPYWKIIVDNLMTHDTTTFRDLMNRISSSISQSSGISIFSSREQEYEQRAQLLKRLAFVILCSEQDQYHKYIPDIQERLADSLRLPQVIPTIQSQVFLCFRVLLIRMSPQHTTSLWPVIVSELVQVFLYIEQELGSGTDTEEFSSHIKLLSALDSSWTVNANNGLLLGHGHPHWLQLQLAAAKLLDLALLLPAHKLPQFQMYRWAFVGDVNNDKTKYHNNDAALNHDFIPHIIRIAKIMDKKFPPNNSSEEKKIVAPGKLLLTTNKINSLQDLHYFFTVLSERSNTDHRLDAPVNIMHLESVIEQDFLEIMSLSSLSSS